MPTNNLNDKEDVAAANSTKNSSKLADKESNWEKRFVRLCNEHSIRWKDTDETTWNVFNNEDFIQSINSLFYQIEQETYDRGKKDGFYEGYKSRGEQGKNTLDSSIINV